MAKNDLYSEKPITVSSTLSMSGLVKLESKYRKPAYIETLPFAKNNTSMAEIVRSVVPDKTGDGISPDGILKHRIIFCRSYHVTTISAGELAKKTLEYLQNMSKEYPMDILSISVGLEDNRLCDVFVIRAYFDGNPLFGELYSFVGTTDVPVKKPIKPGSYLIEREEDNAETYSKADFEYHDFKIQQQKIMLESASPMAPFLNSIDEYTSVDFPDKRNAPIPIYSLRERQKAEFQTLSPYDEFMSVFRSSIQYLTDVEKDVYDNILRLSGVERENRIQEFMDNVAEYHVIRIFVNERRSLPMEDVPALKRLLKKALFDLYIIQDLIDDPDITDIKITDPHSIRVRIRGKAYLSDISFIDDADYIRFINMLALSNGIDIYVPSQTFTDTNNSKYILRFSTTAPYVTANGFPVIHIRKVPRVKLLGDDLVRLGMFDEKIRKYLLDCGKHSRGVVFAGPPGSGKTVALNWFLEEAYEDSAEILVIQENDELFSYKKGIVFEHVVSNPTGDERPCSLEELGQMALVSGANVFVIGEAKGGEICSAITLSNSGCRTAITVHSPSANETIDKMADLAMRGYAQNYEQAKRMIKSFQTIVYLHDFKVQEISEIIGYDEKRKDMIYRPIYKRHLEQQILDESDMTYTEE